MVEANFEFAEPRFMEPNLGSGGPNRGLSMMNLGSGVLTKSASHTLLQVYQQ